MAVAHDCRISSGVSHVLQPKEPFVSPLPASRVGMSTDAAKYLRRNRGSSALWLVKRCASIDLDDDDNDDGNSSMTIRGAPRLSGKEASDIFRRSQGSIGVVLDETNQLGYNSPRPQSRLPSKEAEVNAARHKARVFEQPAQSDYRPPSHPARRIQSAEAKANATKNAGSVNQLLKTDDRPQSSKPNVLRNKSELSLSLDGSSVSRQNYKTPRPRQRVKPEAEENARKNAGTCAAALAGRLPGDRVCDVRASGAGRDNYEASRGSVMGSLFLTYGQQSEFAGSHTPDNIPTVPGNEIAKHGKTGTLCFLMNNYGNLPRSPRPASRLRCEGKRYVCRNSGNNMSKCLNQSTKPVGRSRLVVYRKKKA